MRLWKNSFAPFSLPQILTISSYNLTQWSVTGKVPFNISRILGQFCNGELFYTCDANAASKAQVKQYLAKPSHYTLTYRTEETPRYEHQLVINSLNAKARELGYPLDNANTSTLIVLGSGLGFHLEHLLWIVPVE
jgi:hypothetical protein